MSDRIKGLTVTLEPNIRDDDAQPIIDAIRLIKGVIDVRPHVEDSDHHMAITVAKRDIYNAIASVLTI